ncbi:hypothetical protein EEJ42_38505, partial [Streptomyces botrytidirepellens]
AERLASVPAQPRSALPPADAPVPSADPTALPGNGARVVRGATEPVHRERTTPNEGEGRPRGR